MMNNSLLIGSVLLWIMASLPAIAGDGVQLKSVSRGESRNPQAPLDFSAKPACPLTGSTGPKRLAIDVRNGKPAAAGSRRTANSAYLAKKAPSKRISRFVVAIDAGHGGKDTGAIGPSGVMEKNVVLAIARKLAGFIRAESGMRAVMIRKGDEFIGLRRRVAIARQAGADLLVSVHADANQNLAAKGTSVYARRERASPPTSYLAATHVLRHLKKKFEVHHERVQNAGFMVLKCEDMPCVLVETAFISNPEEESKLRKPRHQERIARALFWGIHAYLAQQRPPLLAGVVGADGRAN